MPIIILVTKTQDKNWVFHIPTNSGPIRFNPFQQARFICGYDQVTNITETETRLFVAKINDILEGCIT